MAELQPESTHTSMRVPLYSSVGVQGPKKDAGSSLRLYVALLQL